MDKKNVILIGVALLALIGAGYFWTTLSGSPSKAPATTVERTSEPSEADLASGAEEVRRSSGKTELSFGEEDARDAADEVASTAEGQADKNRTKRAQRPKRRKSSDKGEDVEIEQEQEGDVLHARPSNKIPAP